MPSWLSWQLLVIIGLVALAVFGYFFYQPLPLIEQEVNELIESEPTDFVRTGTVVFNAPGNKPGVPYLLYEEPGKPALKKELILDALSVCAAPNGAAACMAMSVTLDVPFHGKRATVEGEIRGDSAVLVRKLQVIADAQQPRSPGPGSIFISWPQAIFLIRECRVSMLMQTHSLDVYLTLPDGRVLRAVEPVIDEVFRIHADTQGKCPGIPIATE